MVEFMPWRTTGAAAQGRLVQLVRMVQAPTILQSTTGLVEQNNNGLIRSVAPMGLRAHKVQPALMEVAAADQALKGPREKRDPKEHQVLLEARVHKVSKDLQGPRVRLVLKVLRVHREPQALPARKAWLAWMETAHMRWPSTTATKARKMNGWRRSTAAMDEMVSMDQTHMSKVAITSM